MMTNLFIMFDPSTNLLSLNWLSLFLPGLFLMKPLNKMKNRLLFVVKKINSMMKKDLMTNLKKSHTKIMVLLVTIFNIIWTLNIISLLPFIFTPTSHVSLSLMLSLPLWLAITLKSVLVSTDSLMIHLVPNNTPIALTPFMVMIETVSLLIRPLTLMIRLTANMIAGHVLISLLSQMLNLNCLIFVSSSVIMNILLVLELSVALIQGYVFTILMSLYINESH